MARAVANFWPHDDDDMVEIRGGGGDREWNWGWWWGQGMELGVVANVAAPYGRSETPWCTFFIILYKKLALFYIFYLKTGDFGRMNQLV